MFLAGFLIYGLQIFLFFISLTFPCYNKPLNKYCALNSKRQIYKNSINTGFVFFEKKILYLSDKYFKELCLSIWKTEFINFKTLNEDFEWQIQTFYSHTSAFATLPDEFITSALVHYFFREICRYWKSPFQVEKLT